MKKQAQNHTTKTETYLPLYRRNRNENSIKFFMILAVLLFLVGLVGLGFNLFLEERNFLDLPLWNSLSFITIGAINTFLLIKNLQNKRYYISWNEKAIIFLLPKQKVLELVIINDIKHIIISDRDIKLILNNGQQKRINLNFIYLPKREMVKTFFEYLKKQYIRNTLTNNTDG
jgi:hypothetical protein